MGLAGRGRRYPAAALIRKHAGRQASASAHQSSWHEAGSKPDAVCATRSCRRRLTATITSSRNSPGSPSRSAPSSDQRSVSMSAGAKSKSKVKPSSSRSSKRCHGHHARGARSREHGNALPAIRRRPRLPTCGRYCPGPPPILMQPTEIEHGLPYAESRFKVFHGKRVICSATGQSAVVFRRGNGHDAASGRALS